MSDHIRQQSSRYTMWPESAFGGSVAAHPRGKLDSLERGLTTRGCPQRHLANTQAYRISYKIILESEKCIEGA